MKVPPSFPPPQSHSQSPDSPQKMIQDAQDLIKKIQSAIANTHKIPTDLLTQLKAKLEQITSTVPPTFYTQFDLQLLQIGSDVLGMILNPLSGATPQQALDQCSVTSKTLDHLLENL